MQPPQILSVLAAVTKKNCYKKSLVILLRYPLFTDNNRNVKFSKPVCLRRHNLVIGIKQSIVTLTVGDSKVLSRALKKEHEAENLWCDLMTALLKTARHKC